MIRNKFVEEVVNLHTYYRIYSLKLSIRPTTKLILIRDELLLFIYRALGFK